MKKIIALLLSVMMLAGMTAAFAEEEVVVEDATKLFDVTMVIPEGYTMTQNRQNNNLYIDVLPQEEGKVEYYLSIGYSDLYEDRSIADFSEEEMDGIMAAFSEGFVNPAWMDYTTKEGSLVHLVDETEGESDWAIGFTIYKGYFITVQIENPEYAELSDDDLNMAIELLGDMHFVDNE